MRQGIEAPFAYRRSLWALMTADAVSNLGTGVSAFALSWWVLELTGSALKMGVVSVLTLATHLILGPFLGGLVDRVTFPKKKILQITDLVSALIVGLVGALIWSGVAALWVYYCLTVIQAALDVPSETSRLVLVKGLSQEKHVDRLASLMTICVRGPLFVGPFVGGILITVSGVPVTLFVNAACFLLAPLIRKFLIESNNAQSNELRQKESWKSLFLYLYGKKTLFWMLSLIGLFQFINGGFRSTLIIFSKNVLERGPETVGGLVSVLFGAGLGTALLTTIWQLPQKGRGIYLSGLGMIMGIGLFLMGRTPLLGLALLMVGIVGGSDAILGIVLEGVKIRQIDPEKMGRITVLSFILTGALRPLSVLMTTFFLDSPLGADGWLQITGVLTLCLSLGFLFVPGLGQARQSVRQQTRPEP